MQSVLVFNPNSAGLLRPLTAWGDGFWTYVSSLLFSKQNDQFSKHKDQFSKHNDTF